jgi:hypothetical protein
MLDGDDVEAAFVAAAHEQDGGEFDWDRVARLLNERLADRRELALGERPALAFGARQVA